MNAVCRDAERDGGQNHPIPRSEVESERECRHEPEREGGAGSQTGPDHAGRLRQHHHEHGRAAGTERHPDTNLPRSKGRQVANHTVETDDSQHKGQEADEDHHLGHQ